ncbi:MAG: YdcF family protein [Bacteroidota bacterium]
MFFVLSKVLSFATDPFNWILGLSLFGIVFMRRSRYALKALYSSLVLTLLLSNPLLCNLAIRWWEPDTYPYHQVKQNYGFGILLSGATRGLDEKAQRPLYGPGADRVLQTISLFKSGKITMVLLTGGSGSVEHPEQRESWWIRKVLLESGIPDSCIVVENDSRNTYENAVYSAKTIKGNPALYGKALLITSAFHMRRAEGCFRKAGVEFDAFPVDSGKSIISLNPYRILIPDVTAISVWDRLIHEWIGLTTYRVMGYV